MEKLTSATNAQQFPVTTDQSTAESVLDAPELVEEAFEATILQLDATAGEQLLRKAGV